MGKNERLYSKKKISFLFKEGDSFFRYPFKVVYAKDITKHSSPVQLLVSVSKRNFRKAVDRNRIKRLIREAYRNNKYLLYEGLSNREGSLLLGVIYNAKTIMEYKEIERKIILILQHLIKGDAETTG